MAINNAKGLISVYINKELNSRAGFSGILKKSIILLAFIGAVLPDRLIYIGMWTFWTIVAYFYTAKEDISILGNCVKCGIALTAKLIKALEQLKNNKGDGVDGD